MRDGWDFGLAAYPTLDAFYAAVPEEVRLRSGESDFGVWWYEGEQAWSGCWRVSCVERSGEVYAVKQRPGRIGADDLGRVVVLGSVGPDPGYEKSDALLEGWEQIVGAAESLQWAVDRLGGHRPIRDLIDKLAAEGAGADPEREAFKRGVLRGIEMYAYTSSESWAENGVHYVGTTGTTLADAKASFLEEFELGSFRVADRGEAS